MRFRLCRNCGITTNYGPWCVDCVRAFLKGACAAAGAALVTWLHTR